MCLTIPGKILSIEKGMARVKNGNETAVVDLGLVLGAKKGDWILYATDRAVKKISATDAREIIDLLESKYERVDNSTLPARLKNIIGNLRVEMSKSELLISPPAAPDAQHLRAGNKISNSNVQSSNEVIARSEGDEAIFLKDRHAPLAMTKKDIEYLLNLTKEDELTTLYSEANTLRKTTLKDFVCIHGIIEFSNYCKNNCLYCGIRKDNAKLKRYRMMVAEIERAAAGAIEKEGYKLIVLQSGEDLYYSDAVLIEMVKILKRNHKVFIFLSVGERSESFYKNAFKAGAHGSLFRFETSNPELYAKMHPGHTLKERIDSLKMQKKIGFYIASGSLVGLPGQTVADIANDILMIKKLGIPMISSGPFIPTKGTPLEMTKSKFLISNKIPNPNSQMSNEVIARSPSESTDDEAIYLKDPSTALGMTNEESIEMFLKYIAVARLTMPEIKIPVTTALETLDPENGRHRGLLAGANALMFNLTPAKYCKNYNIYDNKYVEREKVWQKYGLFKGEESYEMLEEQLRL